MRLNKLAVRLSVATLLTLSSSQAMASKFWTDCNNNTPRKWPTNNVTFNANPAGFGGQFTFWRTSFATALSRFNSTPVNLTLNVRLDDDTSVAVGNGESEIWWDNSGNSAIGYNITSPCGRTIEGDIIFHNTVSYDDSMENKANFWNYGGNSRTFETTALHEVGHTVGLAHENRYYNIMGSDYTHVHTTGENALRSYLGEDAVNGLISLYGGSNREDLSVAAWRHIGASGEYSTHGRTRLFNSGGALLSASNATPSCTRSQCELRYNVAIGETIQYEMTLENNGRNRQSVVLGYYISTNATITTTDTLIGTDTVTVTRDTPDTVRKTITLPNNLAPNTNYYLGVIIDNNDSVAEWTEENNTSYMHIRTGSTSQGQAPVAEANGPYQGTVNSSVAFSSAGSNDPDGNINSYRWNFGDGNSSNAANPSHRYLAAGTYTATLSVTDNQGKTAIDSAAVTITGNGSSTLENACATEGPTSSQNLASGNAICVPDTTSPSNPQYYYIYVNAGTNSITIESDHGTGNADVYYKASNWATASSYDRRSSNSGNSESITVTNPATGWQYVTVIGARAGVTLKVTLN